MIIFVPKEMEKHGLHGQLGHGEPLRLYGWLSAMLDLLLQGAAAPYSPEEGGRRLQNTCLRWLGRGCERVFSTKRS
jgi:hypothetical protein